MSQFSTDAFVFEPMPAYKAKRVEYLTSHQIIEYATCPALYRKSMAGLVPRLNFSDAFLIGSATHTLALEGRQAFEREYVVGGPINPKTEKPYGAETKKFAEWAQSTGKTALSDDQFALVCKMATAVRSHLLAAELLKQGVAEAVLRVDDYHGVKAQIRIDWFNPSAGIVDLKTCGDLAEFEGDARKYHYVEQMAFYRSIYWRATDDFVPVHLLAVEKREPYRVGVWRIDTDSLANAAGRNQQAIERLIVSRSDNIWPTNYEELRTLAA